MAYERVKPTYLMHDCSWRKIFTYVFIFQAYVTSLSEALNTQPFDAMYLVLQVISNEQIGNDVEGGDHDVIWDTFR